MDVGAGVAVAGTETDIVAVATICGVIVGIIELVAVETKEDID